MRTGRRAAGLRGNSGLARSFDVVNNLTVDVCFQNLNILDSQWIDLYRIIRQHDEIGQLAGTHRAFTVFLKAVVRGVGRIRFQGVVRTDPFILTEKQALPRDSIYGAMDGMQRRNRCHRRIGMQRKTQARLDGRPKRVDPGGTLRPQKHGYMGDIFHKLNDIAAFDLT